MGALQDALTTQCSTDIVYATGSAWMPYEEWNNQRNINYAGKSGPVTTIIIDKADIDQVLNKLGVVQRGSSVNSARVDHSLPVSDVRKVPAAKKRKIGLQPKDLTVEDLQELVGEVNYQEIMGMYGFTSERYFKEIIKPMGYRLLRGELWVVEDRLWEVLQ